MQRAELQYLCVVALEGDDILNRAVDLQEVLVHLVELVDEGEEALDLWEVRSSPANEKAKKLSLNSWPYLLNYRKPA